MNTIEQIRRVLREGRTIAVVGLSAEWHRPSFFAAKYMQDHGYRIVPVNPRFATASTDVLGEHCYAALTDIPFPVDMVDVFRRTEDVLPIAQQAIQIGAKCLWQQIGVFNRGLNFGNIYSRLSNPHRGGAGRVDRRARGRACRPGLGQRHGLRGHGIDDPAPAWLAAWRAYH